MLRNLLIGAAIAALSVPAMAANILPGSGAAVTGSSIHDGFDPTIAGENLINGTSLPAYSVNGDPRWVFADGSDAVQDLVVNLGSAESINFAGFTYSGEDRSPTSFEVLTSLTGDPGSFTAVAGPNTPSIGTGTRSDELTFGTTSAQYIEYVFGPNSIGTCPGCGGGPDDGAGIIQLTAGIPEPETWAMMLLGAAVVGGGLRMTRRRNSAALAAA